jgi:hypothetical protein
LTPFFCLLPSRIENFSSSLSPFAYVKDFLRTRFQQEVANF